MEPFLQDLSAMPLKEKLKLLLLTKVDLTAISWADLATAIGPNAGRYKRLWQRMQSGSKNPFKNFSPCWSAVPFFGVAWAVARKMYIWAAFLCVGMVIANYVLPDIAAALGLAVAVSFSQKSVYLRWLLAHIQLINSRGLVGEQRQLALQQAGGLNATNGWITAAVLVGSSLALGLVFGF